MSLFRSIPEDGLPARLPRGIRREIVRISVFPGADSLQGGEDMLNLSPRRFPALATRRPRGLLQEAVGSGTAHGLVRFDGGIILARGTALYRLREGVLTTLGTVGDSDKQFCVFGDRLYIYPDKLYVQAGSGTLSPMELDSGVVEGSVFKGNTVTLPAGMTWTSLGFGAGDCLRVANADNDLPAPEGYYHIMGVNGRVATLASSFPATYESAAYFRRTLPSLTRVCTGGDRVYGIAGKSVYISAAGSGMDFYSKGQPDGKDPVILQASSEGDLTACAPWQGYVVFFKTDRICKLLGTRADSFTLQERPGVGPSARLADTLCEVGGDLYYLAEGGVYRYRGQEPERISPVGDAGVQDGAGGTDGVAYYLAVRDGSGGRRLYCYLPEEGRFHPEDNLAVSSMIGWDGFLCIQDSAGRLWKSSCDGRNTGTAADERSVSGPVRASVILPPDYGFQPDGCRLAAVSVRVTGGPSSALEVFAEYADGASKKDADGSAWVSLGGLAGKATDRLCRFPLTPHTCDAVRIRLAMTGDWTVHEVIKEYERIS